jgi:NitT/TauT family transport system substrate-binding protein
MGTLNRLYKMAGLREGDIEKVFMSFPQQIVALENGATDMAMPTEPYASEAIRRGFAKTLITDDKIYPGHQIAVMIFSDGFRAKRKSVGVAFARAYLRGVRDQNAAIVDGKLAGPGAGEFISLIAENTSVKDKDFLRTLTLSNADNDGKLNIDSLREDFEVFRAAGLIEGATGVDQAVDEGIFAQAVTDLASRPR